MIVLILKLILLNVFWTLGFKVVTEDGMWLERLRLWADKKIEQGYKFFEVITCPFCIPNVQGLLFVVPISFFLGIMPFEWNWKYVAMWPFVVGGASFTAGTIWSLYKHLELRHKYFEHLEQQEYFNLKQRKKEFNNDKNKKQ